MQTGLPLDTLVTQNALSKIGRTSAMVFFGSAAILASNSAPTSQSSISTPQVKLERAISQKQVFSRLPIYFEPNRGQFHSSVRFVGRSGPATLYVTASEAAIAIAGGGQDTATPPKSEIIRMKVSGARAGEVSGLSRLPGISNYFIGNDPSRWITEVPQFGKVRASEILPGVDMVYHGSQGRLEYDFVVQPGTDPGSIRLAFDGIRSIRRDASGSLLMETSLGTVKQHRPLVYQEIDGQRIEVASSYLIGAGREVSFQLARYDAARPLVIDPVFDFSAVIPGNILQANSIAVDSSNNSYIAGKTSLNSDYPLINPLPNARNSGNSQVLVIKMNPTGTTLLYSTVLGGSKDDNGYSIGVDNSGNAYVSGETTSSDFPMANAAQGTFGGGSYDAFISKIDAAGSALLWSTYLGGSGNTERAYLAVDKASGVVHAAGYTDSTNFPTTAGAVQFTRPRPSGVVAFVAKYATNGSKTYASYWGAASGTSFATAVAADSSGATYITGRVSSVGVPVSGGAPQTTNAGGLDAFVSKILADGTNFVYSTLLGGSNDEVAAAIAVDSSNNAVVGGSTLSTNFPAISAVQNSLPGLQAGFITKVNAAGTAFLFSTYLGGRKADGINGIALEPTTNNVYAGGLATSDNFPTQNPVQSEKRGTKAVFQASSNGGASWTESDSGINTLKGYALAINPSAPATIVITADVGNIYRSTNSGGTWSKEATVSTCGQVPLIPTSNPNTLYAFGCSAISMQKSTDGGATWNSVGSSDGGTFRAVVASRTDPSILYALDLNNAVRKSVNGGVTWSDFSTGLPPATIFYSIAIDFNNPANLYLGGTGVVYKRTDNGATSWAPVGSGIDSNDYLPVLRVDTAGNVFVLGNGFKTSIYKLAGGAGNWVNLYSEFGSIPKTLAIAPSNPNTLYVGVGLSGLGSVFASTDGGATWTKRASDFEPGEIQVHPTLPNTVYSTAAIDNRTDGFIAKLPAAGGSLLQSTFLGSLSGGEIVFEQVNALATPATQGFVYAAGNTNRLGFPITVGQQTGAQTAFIAKLSDANPPCSLTLSPADAFFYPEGGSAVITIVAPSGCNWTAAAGAPWITFSGPVSGTGIGQITVVVGANPGAERSSTVSFAATGQTLAVVQAAAGCAYSLGQVAVVPLTGGAISIPLTTGAGCRWRASTLATWLTFTNPANGDGAGPATLQLNVAPNPNMAYRQANVYVGTNSTSVIQAGSCIYGLNPTSASIGGQATTDSIAVTASPSTCTWTATPLAGWLTINGSPNGAGNGTVSWSASQNNTGSVRVGTIQIASQIFQVTQSASVSSNTPSVVSLNPVVSTGATQTYTFQFSDPDGYQDLGVMNVLINRFIDGRQACYIAYVRSTNTVYLVNDAGDAGGPFAGGMVLSGSGSIGNSYCTINGAGSSASGSGNVLTLTLNYTFLPAFGGNRVVYMAARDAAEHNSGWQIMGVHGIPPLPGTFPNPVSMNPPLGNTSNATISFTYQDATTANNLQTAWALINNALDGRIACYVAYYKPGNQLYLYPDNGDGSQATSIVLAGTNTIGNSQCTVSAQGSSVVTNGSQLTVNLNITFNPSFAGPRVAWLAVQTLGGAQTSDWQPLGAWRVP